MPSPPVLLPHGKVARGRYDLTIAAARAPSLRFPRARAERGRYGLAAISLDAPSLRFPRARGNHPAAFQPLFPFRKGERGREIGVLRRSDGQVLPPRQEIRRRLPIPTFVRGQVLRRRGPRALRRVQQWRRLQTLPIRARRVASSYRQSSRSRRPQLRGRAHRGIRQRLLTGRSGTSA